MDVRRQRVGVHEGKIFFGPARAGVLIKCNLLVIHV